MKRPKLSTRIRINKIKADAYRKGRADRSKEVEKLIQQLQGEKESQFKIFTNEIDSLKEKIKKQVETIKEESNNEVKNVIKEQAELRKKDQSNHEKQIEKIKTMAMTRMRDMREKAKAEIERANQSENEYRLLATKTQMLFDRGAAKILRLIEEHESMVTDAAKIRHGSNEFFKTKDELHELLKMSQPTLTKLKTKQLEEGKQEK